jgi:hypothetical protein
MGRTSRRPSRTCGRKGDPHLGQHLAPDSAVRSWRKKPSTGGVRVPFAPTPPAHASARSPLEDAAGSAWARLPPMAPRFRPARRRSAPPPRRGGEALPRAATVPGRGTRRRADHQHAAFLADPDSPGTRRMSTGVGVGPGAASSAQRSVHRARSLAPSPKRARNPPPPSTLPARWYSAGTGIAHLPAVRGGLNGFPDLQVSGRSRWRSRRASASSTALATAGVARWLPPRQRP